LAGAPMNETMRSDEFPMTGRERYRRIIRRLPVDRMPYYFGWPRQSTFEAWMEQGLSAPQRDHWEDFIGADSMTSVGMLYDGPVPPFEERVLEESDNKRVWIDHYGVKRLDAVRQPTEGFATRQYLEFPVKSPADFASIRIGILLDRSFFGWIITSTGMLTGFVPFNPLALVRNEKVPGVISCNGFLFGCCL
jgi:hypothetical protein